jgi:hypothetical protein
MIRLICRDTGKQLVDKSATRAVDARAFFTQYMALLLTNANAALFAFV